ncbi:hypothetical protein G7Z17_g3248 [Cylindrodendrum hubeiense]|uniref:Amidohydrolase-related domain-containing protein n=1 Tax=Cylindrodendrum hubeiense TaxID=595255 RepID=A0A9P5HCU2_9HYPO|nr:hypothetical protein G7Z17_g3248 [Cylindrodendrum hubeiense]
MTVFSIKNVGVFNGEAIERPTELYFQGSPGNILDNDLGTAGTIDGTNCTLIPGLIDAKIDGDASTAMLPKFATFGVTTLIDSSSGTAESSAMREASARNAAMPSYLASGSPVGSGGSDSDAFKKFPYRSIRQISTPAEAESFVATHSTGPVRSDFIKVIAEDPGLDDDTLVALVEAAHRRGMLAVAHASQTSAYRRVMEAGFDVVTPAPITGALDSDVVRGFAEKKIAVIPTLYFLRHIMRMGKIDEHNFSFAVDAVRILHQAGVPICAGTSANDEEGFTVGFGDALHEELKLLVEAGLSNKEVLQAATSVPSEVFRLHDRGTLKPGTRADLVLVEGNPLEDIAASLRIVKVWIHGVEVGNGEQSEGEDNGE